MAGVAATSAGPAANSTGPGMVPFVDQHHDLGLILEVGQEDVCVGREDATIEAGICYGKALALFECKEANRREFE